jgi:hypothetical protein
VNSFAHGNPINHLVKDLEDSRRFIDTGLAIRLNEIIKDVLPSRGPAEEDEEFGEFSITKALKKQMKTLKRIQDVAATSDDVGELKAVLTASRDIITQMTKLKDIVDAEGALRIIEDSLVECLDELGDEKLKEKFRELINAKTKHAKDLKRNS